MTTKSSKTRGPKEEALRAARADKAGDIPAFLRRTETPEQEAARHAKMEKAEQRRRGDSAGLTLAPVREPVDPKIAKAIARDLKPEKVKGKPLSEEAFNKLPLLRADQEAGGDAAMARAAAFVSKGQEAQRAANELTGAAKMAAGMTDKDLAWQIANAKKTGTEKLLPIFQAERDKRLGRAIASAKPAKAKKLSPLLARAVALRNNIETQAKGTTEMPKAPKSSKSTKSSKGKVTAQKSIAIAKPKPEKKAKNGSVQIADNAVITVLAKENPKRGKGAKRFDLYRSGMTFAKYVEAQKGNRSQARSDVLFDSSREWIKVSPAPKAA